MVIKALGFDPEDLPTLFDAQELQVTKWGTIKTNFDTMETNLKGVFAAGDIVRGASLVVWAIKDGRDAASSIKNYLESKEKKIKSCLMKNYKKNLELLTKNHVYSSDGT